jgi:hypothetical protein
MSVLDTQTQEIGVFEPGKALHLYKTSIAITPHVTLTEKRHYGSRLLAGIMDVLISLGRKGVILETIVARSSTADGIRLVRGMGFTEIPSITKRRNFILHAA